MKTNEIYNEILEGINKDFSECPASWLKLAAKPPKNLVSKKSYNGINYCNLSKVARSQAFTSPHWATFRQLKDSERMLKKGSKGSQIFFFKILEVDKKDNPKEKTKVPLLNYSTVFNLAQCEDFKDENASAHFKETAIYKIIQDFEVEVRESGNSAFNNGTDNFIAVPYRKLFTCEQEYQRVLAHELIHWTGKLLNRKMGSEFGSSAYAYEELIAEIGSVQLCGELGIVASVPDSSLAYLKNWLGALRDDKKYLVDALKQSTKAVDYLLKRNEVVE